MILKRLSGCFIILVVLAAGCTTQNRAQLPREVGKVFPFIAAVTRTPFQPVLPTLPPTPTLSPTPAPTPTPEPIREVIVWLDESLPPALSAGLSLPPGVKLAPSPEGANLLVGAIRGGNEPRVTWVYALVAPYPTVLDDVSLEDVQRAWRGETSDAFGSRPLRMSASTRAAFSAWWGPASDTLVRVEAETDLLANAWAERPSWALIPFEDLEPRWKVLSVNGFSPLARETNVDEYPLALWFGAAGSEEAIQLLQEKLGASASLFPPANRDPEKMTILAMTGVTALTRATANRMDVMGTTYPASDIHAWLYNADLTHISNEVSFNIQCPPGDPYSSSALFCSRPEYIELLDYLGTDIVELSGNHNNDWGRDAFSYSLDLYNERGWLVYAGGANQDEARQARTIEHNGNRLAFIGCNSFGPGGAWATASQPGAARCEYDAIEASMQALRADGVLPIFTFQHTESYVFNPLPAQERDFRPMIDAGAVIVSGSQAHFPQVMEFYNQGFIHYGLGNLFFDQMDVPVVGTRREFIDRHIFYEGRHISTELLTAMLEDYARPRPMTAGERQQFLSDIFAAAGW